ncbi:MAG: thioredoxin domain-containing protein [Solirubrobacteraceae bacterium]
MASRTKQKEEARARRLAEEQARAEHARRERRLRMIGGVVLAALAVVAVAIAVSSGGGSAATGLQKGPQQAKTVTTVSSLLSGIPQSGATIGSPTAPVTMTYYADLECPICQDFTLHGGLTPLISNEVRQGKVKILYKAFETATRDPSVFKTQQVAALAAGKQNHFWNYAELFYHEQGPEGSGYATEPYLQGLAKQIPGLNLTQWESDRNDATLATQVATDESDGNKIGVSGTPTLVFTGPKGQSAIATAATYSQLQQAIKKVA